MQDMNEGQYQEGYTPLSPQEPQKIEPDTGPLQKASNWLRETLGGGDEEAKQQRRERKQERQQAHARSYDSTAHPEKSAIEKMRDKVADMDEDYKDAGERVLGFFIQLIGYVGPFLFMAWVGADLGKYFAPVMDTVPAYGLAYTIEGVIAACTVSMGRAFAEIAAGRGNYGKSVMIVAIWLILNGSSAFGLYLVITHNGHVAPGIEQYSMVIRVCAIALGDLGCSAVLMFKGRSLQRHIDSIRKRASAIGELADAQRSIEEADKNAALREQMMKATLKIQDDMSRQIGEGVSMVMSSILQKMEKSLKDDDDGSAGNRVRRRL